MVPRLHSAIVDQNQWLERRCFGTTDKPIELIADAKRERGLSVSVCIPALNVEATVASIVEAIGRDYVDRDQLVDELIVINGPSTDQTAVRARKAGAVVIDERDVLPEVGAFAGKGEALWKSLACSHGDVLLWLDSDVHDFDHRIVPAMLAPIIDDPEISFVKAHYQRTFGAAPTGGGRVTEICARPLLNTFFPELAVFAQPLAGEVAARRTLVETLPFCSGYGVEMGMLIDVWQTAHLGAMAQVDLGSRRHDHQDLEALGEMAFAISQVVLDRAGLGPGLEARDRYIRASGVGDGDVRLTVSPVSRTERPPMNTIPGYAVR